MTKNLDSEGLKSIAENYDLFYIDLWGVMHNGIKLHEDAIFTLKKLLEINKNFILLTNAPRPIQPVKEFLKKMGMEKVFRDKVFTSGEACIKLFKKKLFFKKVLSCRST
jgi:ribonucleotide monophosphatase NagD (HAD superfamily)